MLPSSTLEVSNLTINFNSNGEIVEAVKGISFQLKKGEIIGLVGESGSGKSITSLAIMGLLPNGAQITEGSITYQEEGTEEIELTGLISRQFAAIRGKKIAMVFQEPMTALNPVFKCGHQVMEAILLHQNLSKAEAKNETLALFEKVKLAEAERIFNAYPHQLSGGQRQRIMIAMALAGNPSILIADEPTSALDVTVQQSILELFKELKTSWGGAILFISHDLAVVSEIAEKVMVMQKGEIVEEGSASTVFKNPQHSYTRQLVIDSGRKARTETSKTSSKPVLSINKVSKWFSNKKSLFGGNISQTKAVDEVSLTIYEGETLGLVGESGSGKTTLGRTILHLQHPTFGAIEYNGKNLSGLNSYEWKQVRKDMQIIFQDPYSSLNPKMMIGPAIMEPMQVHGIGKDKAEREELAKNLLTQVGLESSHFWRYPSEFSGGQRQRICIARAIASQPKFLICDECVSALDVTVQAKILDLLKDLQQKFGLTYLFISHDLNVVRQISDRVAIMKKGKIIEIGPVQDIFENPQDPYTIQLIQVIPEMP